MPLSSYEFHVNQCCISCSLLGRVWEMLPLFYFLNQICLKLGTGAVQKKLLSVYEFHGKQCSESFPLLAGITEYPYFQH